MPFYEERGKICIYQPLFILGKRRASSMMLENKFKTQLVKEIKARFPGAIVTHLDPTEIQGIPDLLILYKNKWAVLEGKKSKEAPHRPNQDHYIERMNRMSFAAFIYPENKEEVLNELQQAFRD